MKKKDLKIEHFKSSGPGGQHKNKRFTAIRVTHLETGIVSVGTQHRSQAKNKEAALQGLRDKLALRNRRRKRRVPTKKPRAIREKILNWKKKRGLRKKLRSGKIEQE